MRLPFNAIEISRKFELAIGLSIILFVFKIISPISSSPFTIFINESLVIAVAYFWFLYISEYLQSKIDSILSIILNAGILTSLIFSLNAILSYLIDNSFTANSSYDFFQILLTISISYVFLGAIIYIFTVFRELFLLRQKKDPQAFFNIMLLFFLLAYFSNITFKLNSDLDYIFNAFYVVSIILISLNSLRVAWIAFLPKKQKVYLLIISIILSILFGFNFSFTLENNIIQQIVINFSPGLQLLINLITLYGAIYFGVIFFTTLFHLPTAEAFDRKANEVSSLIDLSKLITQVFDKKELADTVTKMLTKVCNSDSAWLVIKNDNGIEIASVNEIGYLEAEKITEILLNETSKENNSLITFNRKSLKLNIKSELKTVLFSAVAIAPLKVHEEISGYLFTARKTHYSFDEDEKKSVEAFADYAAVALENAKLLKESIEKERLEKELDVAREIQFKILPSKTPECTHLKIASLFVPAFEVGGDYYDFFNLGEQKLGFVVADVSGKGISAAFIMAEVKGIFESLAKIIDSPRELLIKVNEILKNSLDKKSFVTAIYGIVDGKNSKVILSRCGHTPILYSHDNLIERLTPAGIGLGLDYSGSFTNTIKEMEINLKNNDILVFYSDGITESKNHNMEDFGYDRLEKLIQSNKEKDVDSIANSIMQELTLFSKDSSQHDDITLVIFKWSFNNNLAGVK
ncbi:MAG: SpoIIE family protein phosphatase [Melioribacteraceae bacterium]|jgi:serine phosphatase RsbU (regulator of sigma subunit)|nr:SpoIIE family protein phosphatase [Melioribacteraceae bacterium]